MSNYYEMTTALIDAHHEVGQVVYLESAPGTGKTSFSYALTERGKVTYHGEEIPIADIIKLGVSAMDTGDLLGVPSKEYLTTTTENGGEVEIPVTEYTTPAWAVRAAEGAKKGIVYVLADEWSRTELDVVGVFLNVLEHGVLPNGFHLGSRVLFILMGNGRQHDRGVYEPTPAMTSRVTKYDFEPDVLSWLDGLVTNFGKPEALTPQQLHSRSIVAAFLRSNPESAVDSSANTDRTKPWACYRSWTHLADALPGVFERMEAFGPAADDFPRKLAAGTVGEVAANEFIDFLNNNRVPTPDELIADPSVLDDAPPYIAYAGLKGLTTRCVQREKEEAEKIAASTATDSAARKARHARTSGPMLDMVRVLNYTAGAHTDVVIGLVTETSRDLVVAHGRAVALGHKGRAPQGVPVLDRKHLEKVLTNLASATHLLDDA